MMEGLSGEQRSLLEHAIIDCRAALEDDLADTAEGEFGIHANGIEDEGALRLNTSDLADRRELVSVIDYFVDEGHTLAQAIERVVREAAFTQLNRFLGIRIAEALGLLPNIMTGGRQSTAFQDVLEVAPLLSSSGGGGYWAVLQLCADELAPDMPALFDPRNPVLSLAPRVAAVDKVVALLAEPSQADLWAAPDTLGWAYQFFNTREERALMHEAAAPRNSRELAVRNQFFTPRYVVDFLVENTLGRRLLESDPDSPLLDDMPLLVDPPAERRNPVRLDDIAVLDPACGSGHFLLGSYDLLEKAWEYSGVPARDAAPTIVRALWGIDIDARCAQVASAAITLRARRVCPDGPLPRPNIVAARPLPRLDARLSDVARSLSDGDRLAFQRLAEGLEQADVLGSLLKVEQLLASEIRGAAFGGVSTPGTLADALAEDALAQSEAEILAVLQSVADEAASTPAQRMLAAEGQDAFRFVEAMRRRYDAVLMNPPFGEPVPTTKPYLKAAYPWMPTRDTNLLAAFVGRGVELCRAGGYVGAITSRAGMFVKTYEAWRRDVLLGHQLVTLADLGFGVMEQAMVEAAAYVLGAADTEMHRSGTFIRLLKDADRPRGLAEATSACRHGAADPRVFRVPPSDFEGVPGAPLAYWMSPAVRSLYHEMPALEGSGGACRVGLQTGDDFRFLRAFWEVDPDRIAASREGTLAGRRWVPFAKGGSYSPYWADIHLVVEWANDGRVLRQEPGAYVRSPNLYFRAGLTWPPRTNSGFGVRLLPAGGAFAHKGPAVFAADSTWPGLVCWLNSRLVQALIDGMVAAGEEVSSGSAARSYEVGLVQKLPWPGSALDEVACSRLDIIGQEIVALRRQDDATDETCRYFVSTPAPHGEEDVDGACLRALRERNARSLRILALSKEAEGIMHEAVGLEADAELYLDREVGAHPADYPAVPAPESGELRDLYEMGIDALVDHAVKTRGGSRALANLTFVADRRLEVLSHYFQCHPSAIAAESQRLCILPPGETTRYAHDVLSYLVGVSFGRWDVQKASEVEPDLGPLPVDTPLPLRPPGMLTRVDRPDSGRSAGETSSGWQVDEQGDVTDVVDAVERAATLVLPDAGAMLSQLLAALGARSVRDYLRVAFFKRHLVRYTKSKRKAPIYWPLQVPSRKWGVWLYAPRLSREMLYAVAGEARRRENLARQAISSLQQERVVGGHGRGLREVDAQLAAESALLEELIAFRAEATRVSEIGWEPELDDGFVLCAAPLARLMPAWPEAERYRGELVEGKHRWATVAKWAEQL